MNTFQKIVANKRLHFVLAVLWLIASFFTVRAFAYYLAYDSLQFDIAACKFKDSHSEYSVCNDNAWSFYRQSLEITLAQLIEMFVLFITPILLVLLLAALIKWIGNYEH
jgi:hypothetical protein